MIDTVRPGETLDTHMDQGAAPYIVSEPDRLLLRGGEVAALMGISRAQAFRWMANGTLPTVRMPGSRTVRVPRAALLRFLEERTSQVIA